MIPFNRMESYKTIGENINKMYNFKKTFLLSVFSAIGLFILTCPIQAKTSCVPTAQGPFCTSEVDFKSFAQTAFDTQKESQWCWAAAISMIFNYYKHPVGQQRIVRDAYGSIVNMPAVSGIVIARQINREWTDNSNKKFTSQLTSAYDFDARVNWTNNAVLVNELDQDRPFIIGTSGHAVVVTQIQYFPTPLGPNIQGIGVFDPYPGRGARNLTPVEMKPMHEGGGLRFIATIKVTDQR